MRKVYLISGNKILDVKLFPKDFQGTALDFKTEYNLDGEWVELDESVYEGKDVRPGVGSVFNDEINAYIAPQPFPSWSLTEGWSWHPPVNFPFGSDVELKWDEDSLSWVEA